jgi:hypothetical protein
MIGPAHRPFTKLPAGERAGGGYAVTLADGCGEAYRGNPRSYCISSSMPPIQPAIRL